MFGFGEILVLVSIGVLFLSWRKIPQLGSTLGNSIKLFKKSLKHDETRKVRDVEEVKKD